jgi:FtsZ-interacting cell division protein ZipA
MSELQMALFVIGLGVIVLVYGYGWWQQRQYSKKFSKSFNQPKNDALYSNAQEASAVKTMPMRLSEEDTTSAETLHDDDVFTPTVLDESCGLLTHRSDFIIELDLHEASPGAVLNSLWSRRFDFSKPIQICGLNLQTELWERVIAESQTLYLQMRIALQLSDRSGVISLTKLADFRDLVMGVAQDIQAKIHVPDIALAHQQAQTLDRICAQVDQMVGVNLIAEKGRLIRVSQLMQAAALQGLRLESDGALHGFDAAGQSLYHLVNRDNSPFLHHTIEHASSSGLTLLLDVPRTDNPVQQFDAMCDVARDLADELILNLVDDHNVLLTAVSLAHIREQISQVEKTMHANDIAPGGSQARRLFA